MAVFLLLPACAPQANDQPSKVCFSNLCYDVEIAQTDAQRAKGLQERTSLEKNAGMLFIFSETRRHSFWMKKTLLPLDIIWMNDARRIVTIKSNIPPCRGEQCPIYVPDEDARFVLEVNAGEAAVSHLKTGDQAVFR